MTMLDEYHENIEKYEDLVLRLSAMYNVEIEKPYAERSIESFNQCAEAVIEQIRRLQKKIGLTVPDMVLPVMNSGDEIALELHLKEVAKAENQHNRAEAVNQLVDQHMRPKHWYVHKNGDWMYFVFDPLGDILIPTLKHSTESISDWAKRQAWHVCFNLETNTIKYSFEYIATIKDALKKLGYKWDGSYWSASIKVSNIAENMRKKSEIELNEIVKDQKYMNEYSGRRVKRVLNDTETNNYSKYWAEIGLY